MPLKDGRLTRGEQAFIEAYAKTQDREQAEKAAKLAPRSGYKILARPDIQAEIARRISAEIHDLGAVAVDGLRYLVTSEKVPAATRYQAIKYTLDRIEGVAGESGAGKELHEMTPEELAAAIGSLEARAADLAKPVEPRDQVAGPGVFD